MYSSPLASQAFLLTKFAVDILGVLALVLLLERLLLRAADRAQLVGCSPCRPLAAALKAAACRCIQRATRRLPKRASGARQHVQPLADACR
jgi:hypothetical protein